MSAPLPSHVKRFIVQLCAVGHTPSECVSAVAQEFSLEVSAPAVLRYNPTRVQGAKLSAALKELFYETRKAARARVISDMPLGNVSERMELLRNIVERNAGKADKITAAALEAARREVLALSGESEGSGKTVVFNVINAAEPIESPVSANVADVVPQNATSV